MSTNTPSTHLAESLRHAVMHWETCRKARAQQTNSKAFTIVLSREAGTDGAMVAREVGKRLGWPVYDHELLERIASDVGVQADLLESVDEHRDDWLKEAFASLMGVPYVAESVYVHRLVKIVLALGNHGECVIVGRGAPFILRSASTFRVRLFAPREHRIAVLSRRMSISEAAAQTNLAALDKDRAAFVREHFHHDPALPHHYDLVLNAARFLSIECAELIVDGLRLWQNRKPLGPGLSET